MAWASWQNQCTSIKSRFEYLLNSNIATDVTFFIGPEKFEIKGHSIMFIIASSVFLKKFPKSNDFQIAFPDLTVESFQSFMQYLYTEKYIGNDNNIFDLYKIAEEFKIKQLKTTTLHFMKSRLKCDSNNETFLNKLVNLPDLWHLPDLCNPFLNAVCLKSFNFFNHVNIINFDKKHIKTILETNIAMQSETEFLKFAICWAKSTKESISTMDIKPREFNLILRDILGPFINLIRFPTMTLEEFKTITQEYDGLLTTAEVFDIVAHISNPKIKIENFNMVKRKPKVLETKPSSSLGQITIKSVETLSCVPIHSILKLPVIAADKLQNQSITQTPDNLTSNLTAPQPSVIQARRKTITQQVISKPKTRSESQPTTQMTSSKVKLTNMSNVALMKNFAWKRARESEDSKFTSDLYIESQPLLNTSLPAPSTSTTSMESVAKKSKSETKTYYRKIKPALP